MPDFYWERPVGVTPRSSMSFMARGTPNDTIQPNCSLCVDPQDAVRMTVQPCLAIGDVPIPNVATLIFENPAADDTRSSSEYLTHYRDTTPQTYLGTAGTQHRDTAVLNLRPNLDYGTGTTEINIPLSDPSWYDPCSGQKVILERWYSIKTGWSYESLANPNGGWLPDTGNSIPDFELEEGYTPVNPDYSFTPTYNSWTDPYPEVSGYYRISTGYYMTTNTLTLSMQWYRSLVNIPDPASTYPASRTLANGKNWAITKNAFIGTADPTYRVMQTGSSNPASLNTTGSNTFTITADISIDGTGTATGVTTSVVGGTCTSVDARLGI